LHPCGRDWENSFAEEWLDTNIVVSAALKPDGRQRTVLLLAISKPARFYVSPAILAEYRDVLSRPELQIRKGLRNQLRQIIESRSHTATPARHLQTGASASRACTAC
jgi:uncharacterized protein